MMVAADWKWRVGFHAPKGVKAEAIAAAIDELKERTPEEMFERSKRKKHVLHNHLWSEGDQVWARKARIDECRRIMGAVQRVEIIGGKEITVRHVEYVHETDSTQAGWYRMDEIVSDDDLTDVYLAEIQRVMDALSDKIRAFREYQKRKRVN